jgi:hypothetical protein
MHGPSSLTLWGCYGPQITEMNLLTLSPEDEYNC